MPRSGAYTASDGSSGWTRMNTGILSGSSAADGQQRPRSCTKARTARLIGTLLDPNGRKDPERREKLALVKAIYAVSMDIGFLNRSYRSDNPVEVEMNKAKITSFLKSHGGCRKPVSSQNLEELKATLKQLKAIRRKEEV